MGRNFRQILAIRKDNVGAIFKGDDLEIHCEKDDKMKIIRTDILENNVVNIDFGGDKKEFHLYRKKTFSFRGIKEVAIKNPFLEMSFYYTKAGFIITKKTFKDIMIEITRTLSSTDIVEALEEGYWQTGEDVKVGSDYNYSLIEVLRFLANGEKAISECGDFVIENIHNLLYFTIGKGTMCVDLKSELEELSPKEYSTEELKFELAKRNRYQGLLKIKHPITEGRYRHNSFSGYMKEMFADKNISYDNLKTILAEAKWIILD